MADIKDLIRARLANAKLDTSHLDAPNAHIVALDGDGKLNVLVKNTEANAAIDKLEAQAGGAANARRSLTVTEAPVLDLGELGQYRRFVIDGIDLSLPVSVSGKPVELQLFSAVANSVQPGAAFYASMDFAFVLDNILTAGDVAVRPIPEGERAGQRFVSVEGGQRQLLRRLLGRAVDSTISVEQYGKAMQAWRELQDSVVGTGLLSAAVSLGALPEERAVPRPVVAPKAPAGASTSGLSQVTCDYLLSLGKEIPQTPDVAWAEATLDALPQAAPDAVAKELRELYITLQDREQALVDDLFGDSIDKKPQAELVGGGASRLAQSCDYKTAQLTEGLAELGVQGKTIRQLATLLAESLLPSQRPAVLILAGPRHSAADRMFELALKMVGDKPLRITRADVAEPGFPVLYGNIRGVPTGADALLSSTTLEQHRENPARHVPLALENLESVGSSAQGPEQQRILIDWLERVAQMVRTGKVNAFAKDAPGAQSEVHEVALRNTVLCMRWEGDPAALDRLLAANPNLQGFVSKVVSVPTPTAEESVRLMCQELGQRLVRDAGAPLGVTVKLDAELEAGITRALAQGDAIATYELFVEQLAAELLDLATHSPTSSYTLGWSRRLTRGERERVLTGKPVPFVEHLFELSADASSVIPPLTFTDTWESIYTTAKRVPELERELNVARAQLATITGAQATI